MKQGQETLAVSDVSLSIKDGQIFGLLGVNGAGKTTFIKMLCTLLEPTSGEATVNGLDIRKDANRVREIVNMIAGGERMLYWRLTGRENLNYFADLYYVDERVKKRRIEELLDLVGLTSDADRRVEQYSKGMKQRLQIARGLINDPIILFMDEPTLGLDAPIAREIRKIIREKLNKTILFTSHYMAEVEELCDEVAIIHKSKIVAQGTIPELKRQFERSHTLLVDVDIVDSAVKQILDSIRQEEIGVVSYEPIDPIFRIRINTSKETSSIAIRLIDELTRAGRHVSEMRTIEPSLEDILVKLSEE